ncbi:DUF1015 family protein [Actinophytocola algeriensis]|uniref:DUF1015 family protein n=1 Tax=Actinophytocola algeriensis TaxID=1768010 RepID=A0A7W7VJP1_9PSEU|nr:DUF1015 family protein [Actinophytocola algeriensis]MBB4912673.1 hypothetical protein [Actinophytocola algeriensis]MBE1471993.1 hypothetical protein [Actinophytocola algeriensis]
MSWVRPIARGWVVRGEVPGPDVDEFAEPDRVLAALADPAAATRSLLAVQHPHRTPQAVAAGRGVLDSLPVARNTLRVMLRTAYREVSDVVAPYEVDGPDGTACGVLCMVDPAAVDTGRVRHSEEVYPEIVEERARVLAGLGYATSAAMLVPVGDRDELTGEVRAHTANHAPAVSTVDSRGRRHRLWLTGDTSLLSTVEAHPLMVADGNHRVAAAARAGGLLALVTSGPALRIGAFHRVLTNTGLTAADLARAWRREGLGVEEMAEAASPTEPGTVVVRCRDTSLVVTLPPGLDHAVVEETLLSKALHLDPEGEHVHPLPAGRTPPPNADAVVEVAPVLLTTVLAEHAAGRRMPRKSTYFTPKPRSGLLLADLNAQTS